MWSAVSGLTFIETAGSEGDLTFGFYNFSALGRGNAVGWGNVPDTNASVDEDGSLRVSRVEFTIGGDVHIDFNYRSRTTDTDLLHVLLHEIGHALGLKHPHEGDPTLQVDTGDWSAPLEVVHPQWGRLCPLEEDQMGHKRHKPEEIVAKLRQVEVLTGQGRALVEAVRSIAVSEQTYFRWRAEYGGMKTDQLKRLKELELENARLRKAVSDLTLDKLILKEAARGNF
jgi:hypothetical protein